MFFGPKRMRGGGKGTRRKGTRRKGTRRRGHQLFNDNPRGHPRLTTLGYGTRKKAVDSVRRLRTMPRAYQRQAATTMYYRAKHHANQTAGMREAMKVYRRFLDQLNRR